MSENRISMRPETWIQGGMIDDADVEVVEAKYCLFDYNGQQPEGPALMLGLKDLGQENATIIPQYWSAGKIENFVPTSDGKGLMPVGKSTGLSKSCNLAVLFDSLLKKGFPVDRIDDFTDHILGGQFHVNKIAMPKIKEQGSGESKDRSCLVVTNVIKWPWDKAKGKAAGKPAATKAPASAPTPTPSAPPPSVAAAPSTPPAPAESNGSGELDDVVRESVIAVAKANGGTVKRADMSTPIFKLQAKHPQKAAIVKRAFDAGYLSGGGDGAWVYDGDAEELMLLQ